MYNHKQYDAARDFVTGGDDNVSHIHDKLRIQAYDLYEDIYINSTYKLKIILRGEDQVPILMLTGRKLIESVTRFLAINVDYMVEGTGDTGIQDALDDYFKKWFSREAFKTKFESGKRWGLVRGDTIWYLYADEGKDPGSRVSITEIDPRQVFEIEDNQCNVAGYHLVDKIQDFREPDEPQKQIVRRRTFRKELDEFGVVIKASEVSTELTFWELNRWDDRCYEPDLEQVKQGAKDHGAHDPIYLGTKGAPITQFPIYKWNNQVMQNTTWGTSQLAGTETLLYALNQSMTDEDATIVFQGLGMYVTTAAPPINPQTGQLMDWNIGPMQIIEVGMDQKFDRVSGITDVSPFQDHMSFIDEKGLTEGQGIPEVAIGRVDVATAQSGIALYLQLMPLLAQNAEKELGFITLLDQMFHDMVTMWLPAFEPESFGNFEAMQQASVVCIFDDPMPVDRTAKINEVVLLEENNLILTKMAVKEIRNLGYQYPATDEAGNPLTDDDIVDMLLQQAADNATATTPPLLDPNVNAELSAYDAAAGGTPPPPGTNGNTPPAKQTVRLGGG